MQYSIRHVSHFLYEAPISQSIMEVRACPRTEAQQYCYSFALDLSPHAQVFSYQDFDANTVHHFTLPGKHTEMRLESNALVEVRPPPPTPNALAPEAWDALDALRPSSEHLEMTLPSTFARSTPLLRELADELGATRRDDPLTLLREVNERIYQSFAYSPKSTHARSPIDESLESRRGVCQDFAHIFIALARSVGIPCRYVSGYLFHRKEGDHPDRSAEDGSHAWAEAFLPETGWVGFDPTNNLLAGERHIRVAIGRDYSDVPPTRGLFKGSARSRLHVGVRVAEATFPISNEGEPDMALVTQGADADLPPGPPTEAQQQQ